MTKKKAGETRLSLFDKQHNLRKMITHRRSDTTMTRINAGIDPASLHRQHLLAEHREIKRIPNMVASGKAKIEGIPKNFTLGKGHVKFFYDKLGYLKLRYISIHNECRRRGYNVTNYENAWNDVPTHLMNQWTPSPEDTRLVFERIQIRLREKDLL